MGMAKNSGHGMGMRTPKVGDGEVKVGDGQVASPGWMGMACPGDWDGEG